MYDEKISQFNIEKLSTINSTKTNKSNKKSSYQAKHNVSRSNSRNARPVKPKPLSTSRIPKIKAASKPSKVGTNRTNKRSTIRQSRHDAQLVKNFYSHNRKLYII